MSQVQVTLPDGSSKSLDRGAPVSAVAEAISPRLAAAALAAAVDDKLVDLTFPLEADARVRIITDKSPEALTIYRHSTAHLLAAAVTALFPEAQCGIGPPTDEGFFYDFVVPRPFVPEDLDAIEKKMRELAQADFRFERQMWPREEAKRFFGARGEPLKVQLIDEKTEGQPAGVLLHHQGQRNLRGLLRRPARAVERPAEGLQAADDVERLLEGRRAQPADAARVRHGVLLREGAGRPSQAARRSQGARSPQDRQGPEAVPVPPLGPGRHLLAAEGHDHLQHAARPTCARCWFPPATPR